jgi:hypothetical protein
MRFLTFFQTVKTEATQSGEEYRYNQDVTAPPDPVAPGSTTDVPIRGEKTNILFHPTPSVSYEPMFAALEKQAGAVCVGVVIAVVVLGKMFGGKLVGLIPLAMCLASGIWLWMKEVVRSGREVEWHSEKERGQMVGSDLIVSSLRSNSIGYRKLVARISRMAKYYAKSRLGHGKS